MAKPNRRKRMSRRHGKRGKCWSRRHGRAFKKACGKRSSSWKSRKSANANGISDKVKPKKPMECKQDEIHEVLAHVVYVRPPDMDDGDVSSKYLELVSEDGCPLFLPRRIMYRDIPMNLTRSDGRYCYAIPKSV